MKVQVQSVRNSKTTYSGGLLQLWSTAPCVNYSKESFTQVMGDHPWAPRDQPQPHLSLCTVQFYSDIKLNV